MFLHTQEKKRLSQIDFWEEQWVIAATAFAPSPVCPENRGLQILERAFVLAERRGCPCAFGKEPSHHQTVSFAVWRRAGKSICGECNRVLSGFSRHGFEPHMSFLEVRKRKCS